jgi:peptidoglycan/LPS O-acetylase OafA/YrhL
LFAILHRLPDALSGLRQIAESTPSRRDRHLDFLRAVAILAVVLGHWLAIVVAYRDGFTGDSIVAFVPWTRPLTWLFQVMPVFFLVGGFSNVTSLDSYRRRGGTAAGWMLARTDRLIRPTTVLLLVLGCAALSARLAGVDWPTTAKAVWLACIPLWFLVAYITVVFLTPMMLALHERAGLAVPVLLAVLVGLGDAARLTLGPLFASGNFLFAWLAVHQLGIAWRRGALTPRRAVAVPLAGGGLLALVLLTVPGPYPVSMVMVPGEVLNNTSPPTLALVALAATQTGLALLLHDRVGRWLRRTRPWMIVVAVNTVIMTIFLWHMTAAVIAVVLLYPTGLMPQPPPDSVAWWLLRVPWLAVLGLVLAVLIAVFGRVERRAGPSPDPALPHSGPVRRAASAAGSAAVVLGLLLGAASGLGQGASAVLPVASLLVYLAGAGLLRALRMTPGS